MICASNASQAIARLRSPFTSLASRLNRRAAIVAVNLPSFELGTDMNPTRPIPRGCALLAATVATTLALAACDHNRDDTAATGPAATPVAAPQSPAATAAPTLAVNALSLGTTAGPDGRITTPITTFTTSDPIVVAIETSGTATDADLVARLVHEDGKTAGEQNRTISSSGTGSATISLTFTNANGWPAGSYRAEVWIDGAQARSREFQVR